MKYKTGMISSVPPTLLIVVRLLELGAMTSAEASIRGVSAGLMPP